MSWWNTLVYFLSEAWTSSRRSWKVSTLAVLTICVSLFTSGLFLWLSQNLSETLDSWRRQAVVVAYIAPDVSDEDLARVRRLGAQVPLGGVVRTVTPRAAQDRFRNLFPSLRGVVDQWAEDDLPTSIEVEVGARALEGEEYWRWRERLDADTAVQFVDDDRDWIDRLEGTLDVSRAVGWVLVSVLLGAAIFTIASVVRLTAYLYRDEISVMRVVGATETFIRGPFYAEGTLQGLAGSVLALCSLGLLYRLAIARLAGTALWGGLTTDFLSWQAQIGLFVAGGMAGWLGAFLSLRKTDLA